MGGSGSSFSSNQSKSNLANAPSKAPSLNANGKAPDRDEVPGRIAEAESTDMTNDDVFDFDKRVETYRQNLEVRTFSDLRNIPHTSVNRLIQGAMLGGVFARLHDGSITNIEQLIVKTLLESFRAGGAIVQMRWEDGKQKEQEKQ